MSATISNPACCGWRSSAALALAALDRGPGGARDRGGRAGRRPPLRHPGCGGRCAADARPRRRWRRGPGGAARVGRRARGRRGAARARALGARARRRAQACRRARRGAGCPARGARRDGARGSERTGGSRARGARRRGRAPAPRSAAAVGAGVADGQRGPRGGAGGGGPHQQGDRPAPVRDRQSRPVAPAQRLPQARRRLAPGAAGSARSWGPRTKHWGGSASDASGEAAQDPRHEPPPGVSRTMSRGSVD